MMTLKVKEFLKSKFYSPKKIYIRAEYVDKSSLVNKQFIDSDRLKYGENSNTCIMTVSGNFNSMGTVINANNEITRILGFTKSEIIGQNISKIQPKVYADIHDTLMRNYFETSESRIIGVERVVFPINKRGYLVPCTLMIKILPNLEEGVKIVGFLKEIETEVSSSKTVDFENEDIVGYLIN